MKIWGITALSHDASLAVFDKSNGELNLLFASQSERFSGIKNDPKLSKSMIDYCIDKFDYPESICFYENGLLKKTRQLYAGQFNEIFKKSTKTYCRSTIPNKFKFFQTTHHLSHASAGYYTSNFNDAIVLVLDAIGEWDTFTIWQAANNNLSKVFQQVYPHSVGLWFSAMTHYLGLKPQEHEYILMGMAALGNKDRFKSRLLLECFTKMPSKSNPKIIMSKNFHKGFNPNLKFDLLTDQCKYDFAAAVQSIYEDIFRSVIEYMSIEYKSKNLVMAGGCILNCVANSIALEYFNNIWIMPNPGDSGSCIGSVLTKENQHISWPGPFLGYDIKGHYPFNGLIGDLIDTGISAVACGPAEFGPRSLGHRSILADPRGINIKDLVNQVKQREPFRPFAPMILEEHAHKYFEVPVVFSSHYMQYVVKCKSPLELPAIVHYDQTSRLQTVPNTDEFKNVRLLLEKWYRTTGCPMLLNTSLNIKNKPLVNTETDAKEWQKQHGLKVHIGKQ